MKGKLTGTVVGLTLLVGGTVFTDAQINPYTDVGDKLEIASQSTIEEAGENRIEVSKVEPAVTLKKWNGEVGMTVKYDKVKSQGNRPFLSNKVEWKNTNGKEEVHTYPLEAKEGMEDGGLEIEVILNEKPTTNVFDFTITGAENLDFFYQPPLTQQKIDEGAERPENVVGSYAVYHKTKTNHQVGSTNYATGKAYHIYRPKVIDANGIEMWAELSYMNGVLTVTVPQTFLDSAVYPVRVDPTLGYTTAGASQRLTASNQFSLDNVTGVAGTGDSISAYIRDTDTDSSNAQYQLYNASDNKVTNGVTNENTAISNVASWITLAFPVVPTLTAQTYYLAVWSDEAGGPGGNVNIYYDTTGGDGAFIQGGQTYKTWPDPVVRTADVGVNGILSIYITYTASAVAPTPTVNVGGQVILEGQMIIQ